MGVGGLRSAGFLIIDPDRCRETPVDKADPFQLILREPRCQVKNDPLGGCEAASVECINSLLKALASALYIFEHLTPSLLTLCCWTQRDIQMFLIAGILSQNKMLLSAPSVLLILNERKF